MYFEDVDLGQRVGRVRARERVRADRRGDPHRGALDVVEPSPMEIEHHRSAYRFLSRKYRAWWLWPLRAVLHAGLSVRARWVTRK